MFITWQVVVCLAIHRSRRWTPFANCTCPWREGPLHCEMLKRPWWDIQTIDRQKKKKVSYSTQTVLSELGIFLPLEGGTKGVCTYVPASLRQTPIPTQDMISCPPGVSRRNRWNEGNEMPSGFGMEFHSQAKIQNDKLNDFHSGVIIFPGTPSS